MKREDFECQRCDRKDDCIMAERLQRLPRECGGLGLCPKLKEETK